MRWTIVPAVTITFWLLSCPISSAWAAAPEAFCRSVGTDDTVRAIPDALVPGARKLFHLESMPVDEIRRGTFFRCFEGRVLVCTIGANLPCGKADTRDRLPGTDAWCAENPGSEFIPMAVTGHDTIYRWRCLGTKAAVVGTQFKVDPRGFVVDYWKPLGP
jgi:hypothetical protein